VIVLVFLAGTAVGFFLHHAMPRRGFPGLAIGGPPPGPPPGVKSWMLERLDRDLELTAAQHARIDTVLTRREADLRALMSEARPRFEAIATRTRAEIQSVLTPAQQEEFAKITQRMDARRARRGHP
jgi:Spy/CpxP family protein refolding chaperone